MFPSPDAQTVEPGTVLYTIEPERSAIARRKERRLETALSGGQMHPPTSGASATTSVRPMSRKSARLQQRLTAIASQVLLKERQVQNAREIAARRAAQITRRPHQLDRSIETENGYRSPLRGARSGPGGISGDAGGALRQRFEMASPKAAFDRTGIAGQRSSIAPACAKACWMPSPLGRRVS